MTTITLICYAFYRLCKIPISTTYTTLIVLIIPCWNKCWILIGIAIYAWNCLWIPIIICLQTTTWCCTPWINNSIIITAFYATTIIWTIPRYCIWFTYWKCITTTFSIWTCYYLTTISYTIYSHFVINFWIPCYCKGTIKF